MTNESTIHQQYMEILRKQIEAITTQCSNIGGREVCHHQTTPRFMNEDNMVREVAKIRSQSVVEEEDGFIEEDCLVDWASPPICDTYPDEEVSSIHHVLDKSLKSEVFDVDVNEVDFLGVEHILSNFLDAKVFDDFYVEKNMMFKTKVIVDPFREIFMACEREIISGLRVKIALC